MAQAQRSSAELAVTMKNIGLDDRKIAESIAAIEDFDKEIKRVRDDSVEAAAAVKGIETNKVSVESSVRDLNKIADANVRVATTAYEAGAAESQIDLSVLTASTTVAELQRIAASNRDVRDTAIEAAAAEDRINRRSALPIPAGYNPLTGNPQYRDQAGSGQLVSPTEFAAARRAAAQLRSDIAAGGGQFYDAGGNPLYRGVGGRFTRTPPPGIPLGPATDVAGRATYGSVGSYGMGGTMVSDQDQFLAERKAANQAQRLYENEVRNLRRNRGLGSVVPIALGSAEADARRLRTIAGLGETSYPGLTSPFGAERTITGSVEDIVERDARAQSYLDRLIQTGGGGNRFFGGQRGFTGGGGGGGNRNFNNRSAFSGILPGGRRAGAGVVTTAIGIGVAAAPSLVPGIAAAAPVLGAAATTLVGALGTVKLAFADITSAAFSTKAAFDKLTPTQQAFVQSLRSLDAGFTKPLESLAQSSLLPKLTSALHLAFTPAAVTSLRGGVSAFGNSIGSGAQDIARLFGSTGFQNQFGKLLLQDAGYMRTFLSGIKNLIDAFVRFQVAAGPLLTWLGKAYLGLTRWVDVSVKADQANGRLAKAFDVMKQSLQVIGGLLVSIGHVGKGIFDAIGFKNSAELVKLVTAAFNGLAHFLEANRGPIRGFFSAVIGSLNDLKKAVGPVVQQITNLLKVLESIGKPLSNMTGGVVSLTHAIDGLLAVIGIKWLLGFGGASKGAESLASKIGKYGVAGEAAVASGAIATMLGKLKGLAGTVAVATILLSIIPQSSAGQSLLDSVGLGFLGRLPIAGPLVQQAARFGSWFKGVVTGQPDSYGDFRGAQAAAGLHPGQWVNAKGEIVGADGLVVGKIKRGSSGLTGPASSPNAGTVMNGSLVDMVAAIAQQNNVDPAAALAIANTEGLSGSPGDYGKFVGGKFVPLTAGTPGGQYTSFGPFQLHQGGKLPAWVAARGPKFAQQWANSPAGIQYAIAGIAKTAGGLKGDAALRAVSAYETPANPLRDYYNATGKTPPFAGNVPFDPTAKTNVLPQNLQTQLDNAQYAVEVLHKPKRIEVVALKAAIAWIKAHIGPTTGDTRSLYDQEGITLAGQLATLIGTSTIKRGEDLLPPGLRRRLDNAARAATEATSTTPRKLGVIGQAFSEFPGLQQYRRLFAFKTGGTSSQGYQSESYQPGEQGSFAPNKRAIRLYGTSNKPADVAGEIVSHFLTSGLSPALTKLYKQFIANITPSEMSFLKKDYAREGGAKSGRSFAAYEKASGLPALFRGSLFHQLDSGDVTYTPAQKKIFAQVKKILGTGEAGGYTTAQIQANKALLAVQQESLKNLESQHKTGKQLVALKAEEKTIQDKIAATQAKISREEESLAKRLVALEKTALNLRLSKISTTLSAITGNLSIGFSGASPSDQVKLAAKALLGEGKLLVKLQKEFQNATTDDARNKIQKRIDTVTHDIGRAQVDLQKGLGGQAQNAFQKRVDKILGIGPNANDPSNRQLLSRERRVLTAEAKRAGVTIPANESVRGIIAILEKNHDLSKVQLHTLHKINQVIELAKREHRKLSADEKSYITGGLSQIDNTLKGHKGLDNTIVPSAHFLTRGLKGKERIVEEGRLAQFFGGGKKIQGLTLGGIAIGNSEAARLAGTTGKLDASGAGAVDRRIEANTTKRMQAASEKAAKALGKIGVRQGDPQGGVPRHMTKIPHDIDPGFDPKGYVPKPAVMEPYTQNIVINVNGYNKDPKELAREISNQIQKNHRRNPTQTRGAQAGKNQGMG